MRKVTYIIALLLLISCAPPMQVYDFTPDLTGEKIFEVRFGSVQEAWRVKRRIERRGLYVPISNKTLFLSIDAVQLRRPIFKKRGYISEKYRYQIEKQL